MGYEEQGSLEEEYVLGVQNREKRNLVLFFEFKELVES